MLWVFWVSVNTIFFNEIIDPKIDVSIFFIKVILPFIIYLGVRLNFVNLSIRKQWLFLNIALFFYLVLVLFFETNNVSLSGRLGYYINPNEISWIALLTLFSSFLIIRNRYVKFLISIFVFILIFLTASKKALLGFLLFFILYFMLNNRISFLKRLSIIVLFLMIFSYTMPLILENTLIGERIQQSVEQNEHAEDDSELFDGRANFYIIGMKILEKNPLTGIGLTNFYYFGEMDLVAHSEYIVQIVELGIISFILFLFFHFRILISLVKLFRKKEFRYTVSVLIISVLIFYGMFLGRWVYDNIEYNIFMAIIVNTIINFNKVLDQKLKISYEDMFYRR